MPSQSSVDSWAAQRGGHPRCAQPAWPGPGGVHRSSHQPWSWTGVQAWGAPGPCSSGCLAVAVGWGQGGGLGDLRPGEGSASLMFTENSLCAGAVLGKRGVSEQGRAPRPRGPIVWGTASGKWTQNVWMVAVS